MRRLDNYLSTYFPFSSVITIADNASTDSTWQRATTLADELPRVRAVHLDAKGRGRALHQVWTASSATVVAYMDVDLSTDLDALLPLVAPLLSGHSDVAIGSRLSRSSRVTRGPKRELISRSYNLLLRTTLRARFSDAQCGFKAMRVECARALLPHVRDTSWFFDTELLVLAERSGLRIAEVPVDWVDDPDSRVDVVSTAMADLRGIARVGRSLVNGELPVRALRAEFGRSEPSSLLRQAIRFGAVGVLSTLAYLLLFLWWRSPLGALGANFAALLVTAVANTAVKPAIHLQRGAGRRTGALRHQAQGLLVFLLGLGLTSGALWLLGLASAHPPRAIELGALIVANLASTVLRFVLLREWVFARSRTTPTTNATSEASS